jgi:curved DNA-binding protein CbpA
MTTMRRASHRPTLHSISFLLWGLFYIVLVGSAEEDLYKLLGVKRTATTKEIKSAYRRKALDTHPDKNRGVPPEEAAAAFHKVVHAFETLSDSASRSRYDKTGRTDGSSGSSNNNQRSYGGFNPFHFTSNRYRKPIKLKDRFDVQEAMSRVMHIVSLEQLKLVMLDDDDKLERNILMCFVNPPLEKITDDDMVFPWPFAAMSEQGIWWEDLLQTVKIRYHKENDITRFFGVPNGNDLTAPVFIFGKRGEPLSGDWERIQTSNRKTLENWIWQRIEVQINIINNHPHPVEVYWIHGSTAHIKCTLQPGESKTHTTMLTHEWWVRDARTDRRPDSPGRHQLTNNTCLANWKIVKDEGYQELIIEPRTCFDLSGHCSFWKQRGQCQMNPKFMHEVCQKTCRVCKKPDANAPYKDEF